MYLLRKVALYLNSVFVHDMSSGNPDVTDRSSRGLQRPWDSAGHHVYILNEPEQLRGPLSPHRKTGTQNGEAGGSDLSIVACVPLSTQGRLCVLDFQDSCCPHFISLTRPPAGTPMAGKEGQVLPSHMLGESFQSIRLSI